MMVFGMKYPHANVQLFRKWNLTRECSLALKALIFVWCLIDVDSIFVQPFDFTGIFLDCFFWRLTGFEYSVFDIVNIFLYSLLFQCISYFSYLHTATRIIGSLFFVHLPRFSHEKCTYARSILIEWLNFRQSTFEVLINMRRSMQFSSHVQDADECTHTRNRINGFSIENYVFLLFKIEISPNKRKNVMRKMQKVSLWSVDVGDPTYVNAAFNMWLLEKRAKFKTPSNLFLLAMAFSTNGVKSILTRARQLHTKLWW